MKNFIGQIIEQHGEFTAEISIMFSAAKGENAEEIFEEIVADWYGLEPSEEEKESGVFWNDHMTYQAGAFYQITKATYKELKLKGVFHDLSVGREKKTNG